MTHDFIRFPELTNSQMQFYYLDSPHKQITSDIRVEVIKVVDGDTIRVKWEHRDFDFPVRFLDTNAPEMNEGGEESKAWLEGILLREEVDILVNPRKRVGKWGRLLGIIMHRGMNINEMSMRMGQATSFANRNEGKVPPFEKELQVWF